MFRYALNLAIILALGLIQLSNSAFIFGIKPNLVLCFVVVASIFTRDWFEKAILVLAGAIVLKFHPGFGWADALFILSAFIGILFVKYLTWQTTISIFIAITLGTVLINIDYLNTNVITEILINLAVAFIIYPSLKIIYEKK